MKTTIFEIAERMKGQDNRATAFAIYCVQVRRKVFGVDLAYIGRPVYVSTEGTEFATEEEAIQNQETHNEDYECVGVTDYWETVQSFFSCEGAEKYIEENAHNMDQPRIYVASAHRNDELVSVIQFLGELAEGKWVVQPS